MSRVTPENLNRKLPDRMLLVQDLIFREQYGDIFVVVVCFIVPRSKPQGFISYLASALPLNCIPRLRTVQRKNPIVFLAQHFHLPAGSQQNSLHCALAPPPPSLLPDGMQCEQL